MEPITIPVTLYSLENARQEMSDRTDHDYGIAAVRRAVRESKLKSIRVDDRTVVVTSEAIEEYLRKHARFSGRKGEIKKRST